MNLRSCASSVVLAAFLLGAAGVVLAQMPSSDSNKGGTMRKAARPELGTSAAFAPDGVLHVVSKQGGHVVLFRSRDEGASWSAPQLVNADAEPVSADGENRPKIAFAADGGVLVSWTRPLSVPFSGEIRLARAADGKQFSAPITVHVDRAEITHRFESMIVAPDGRIVLAWVDKRDLEAAKASKVSYRGAAIYAAVSTDGGRSFRPEEKIADHSCECCRIASAIDVDGSPVFMWRHVFAPNERDHALARLADGNRAGGVQRVTYDRWKIDGCPHHGPSLAIGSDGSKHAVWFNQVDGEGQVSYGRLPGAAESGVHGQRRVGGAGASHADLVVSGNLVGIAWKEFDGGKTRLRAEISEDGGTTFRLLEIAQTEGASDQPRTLLRGQEPFVFWRTEREGMRLYRLK